MARSSADKKLRMSPERLAGLAAPDASVIKQLPSIAGHELLDLFVNTDFAFLMSGLGGAAGSLGSRVFSVVARARNVPAASIVTCPFSAESIHRREMADRSLDILVKTSDLCIVFDNDKLSSLAPNLQLSRAFGVLNGIMMRPVKDICSAIGTSDISVLQKAVDGSEYARFGLGLGRGDERIERVVSEAFSSPWFDFDVRAATAAVVVFSAADPWDKEAESAISRVEEKLPSARLLWGTYADSSLRDRIRLSLILCRGR